MLLVIDSGNTNIVFGLYHAEKGWLAEWRMATSDNTTCDEYAAIIMQWLETKNFNLVDIKAVVLSSVVPAINQNIKLFTHKYLAAVFFLVGTDGFNPKMQIDLDRPEELGSDRIVNAWQATRQYGMQDKGLVVIDFGTATTFDVVNDKGVYIGGIIAPGVELSMKALTQAAAKLSRIDFKKPPSFIGKNTVGAVQSGFFYGVIGSIEKIIENIRAEENISNVIATGGLASLIAEECSMINHVDNHLILNGLKALYYEQ